MRIIPQMSLFSHNEDQDLGDLERLLLVINYMPDEKIIHKLRRIRGKGRNDWPVEAMWNAFLASFVFEHQNVSDLLRELRRNRQFREMCGFEPKSIRMKDGTIKIILAPPNSAFTNFLNNLKQCKEEIREAFDELVEYMYEHLDHFGELLAADGKAIQSYATNYSKKTERDGRRDKDADWCRKEYTTSINEKGEKVIKTVKWFGYRLHLIVDAQYELPVDYRLTKASGSEQTNLKEMLDVLEKNKPKILDHCEYFLGDRGYDGMPLIKKLEAKGIAPIIDICNKWRDGEKTKQYRDTPLTYTFNGKVFYTNDIGKEIELMYKGYDKRNDSARYGFHPKYNDKRIFRIKLDEDRRIFLPVGRQSKKFKRLYRKRTSVERVNGRLDRDYGFENHTIRGKEKMEMFIGVTFLVGLTMAKAKIEKGNKKHLASLVS